MCKNADKTALGLMTAIRPTIVELLGDVHISTTEGPGQLVLTEYDNVVTDLSTWTPGTVSTKIIEVMGDLQTGFDALPIPAGVKDLEDIIEAGLVTVIGVVTANSPAPAPTAPVASEVAAQPHEIQGMHAMAVAADTQTKVETLVPGFKRSAFHSPASQYTSAWKAAKAKHTDGEGEQNASS